MSDPSTRVNVRLVIGDEESGGMDASAHLFLEDAQSLSSHFFDALANATRHLRHPPVSEARQ